MFTIVAVELALFIQKRTLKLSRVQSVLTHDVCHVSHQALLRAVVTYKWIDELTHPKEKQDALLQLQHTMDVFASCMNDRIHVIKQDPIMQEATDILKKNK
jgi:hypothetical protein